jgi:hypothetical protein
MHRTARSAQCTRASSRASSRARASALAALHAYVRAPNVQTSAMGAGGRLMPPQPSGQQYLRVMQGMGIGP